jgi:hypothetical protein
MCDDDDRLLFFQKQNLGLVCPSRTSERGGEGYCVKGGGGES